MTKNPYTRARKFITAAVAVAAVYVFFLLLVLVPVLMTGEPWMLFVFPAGFTVLVSALMGLIYGAGFLINRAIEAFETKEEEWENKHD